LSLAYLFRHLSTNLQPQDPHKAVCDKESKYEITTGSKGTMLGLVKKCPLKLSKEQDNYEYCFHS